MADENESKIQDAEIVSVKSPEEENQTSQTSAENSEPKQDAKAEPAESADKQNEKPQVIIQHERGISYYVGFALLTVLAICFFFIPGISLVYIVSCIAAISAPVAWIFAALLSVIVWFIFKLKIKGFKKSFFWYIGLCVLVSVILVSLTVLTSYQILSGIFSLLIGGSH